jgi:hypothetical protein
MTEQGQSLQREIAALRECAAHRFDPVQFRYIESLLQRSEQQPESVAAILEDKTHRALENYRQRYTRALEEGALLLAAIESGFPDAAAHAQELQRRGQLMQLEKLLCQLQHPRATDSAIGALTILLNQQAASHGDDPDSTPLEELLRTQEAELITSLAQAGADSQPAVARKEELKAARRFRNAQVKLNADKLVTQAIDEIPEECGPLNAQRLAARSLAAMRDLSPYYLSRFVTYIDTLFWLEQAEKKSGR